MKDPTRTPEPNLKRKEVKVLRPKCNAKMESKANEYGYVTRYSNIIGCAMENVVKRQSQVAFDTNKTRRSMIKPTEKY